MSTIATQSALELPSIFCRARLGWDEEERSIAQPVCLRVSIRFGAPPPATQTDQLGDTVDYAAVVASLEEVCGARPYRLIESLTRDAYRALKEALPAGAELWVAVAKAHPPLVALNQSAWFGLGDWRPASASDGGDRPLPPLWRQPLADADPEIAGAIGDERRRQGSGLELIASENFASRAVLEAAGSVLTNKYAEGYPGKRYYGGCECVDTVERAAIARAKSLFSADHANVQPHSGAQANMAVYLTLLQPGDTVLGMNLAHGGHLTHGHPLNFSGKLYRVVPYGVRASDERIDYDELDRLADEHRPKMIMVGASAYPRIIDFQRMRRAAERVGAAVVTDMAHIAGLVVAGLHPSPVTHSDFVTTTTHKTLRGPRGGMVLCRARHAKELDRAVFPGMQGGPLMHIIAAKAVCLKEAAEPAFAAYQRQVVANAQTLAAALGVAGFRLVSGGTDNHMVLVDVLSRGLTGRHAEAVLATAGITVNKNAIPFDKQPPMVASGIRIGTPAVTTRGMGGPEMELVADLVARALATPDDDRALAMVRAEVEALCRRFPLYPEASAPLV